MGPCPIWHTVRVSQSTLPDETGLVLVEEWHVQLLASAEMTPEAVAALGRWLVARLNVVQAEVAVQGCLGLTAGRGGLRLVIAL